MKTTLPPRDLVLIAIVVIAWGSNFSAMKIGLEELPPLLFVGLRFAILVPLIAVLPRPEAPFWAILGVGLLINTGQFAFLFSAMSAGVSAGLASLLLQAQAPLTILLAVVVFRETVSLRQLVGIAIAAGGMALIGFSSGGSVTPFGLFLVLCGALSWASGNLILKTLPGAAMLPIFVWASLVPPLPMLWMSISVEAADPFALVADLNFRGWAALIYVAVFSTVLGYSLWGNLLARHAAANVTPFALLIPVVGMAVAAVVLGETLTTSEAIGAAITLIGLFITVTRRRRA